MTPGRNLKLLSVPEECLFCTLSGHWVFAAYRLTTTDFGVWQLSNQIFPEPDYGNGDKSSSGVQALHMVSVGFA